MPIEPQDVVIFGFLLEPAVSQVDSRAPFLFQYPMTLIPLHETYANLLRQASCSFPNSSMLVEPMESLQRSRAVISLGVDLGLAGPIFIKFLRFKDAFKSLSSENPQ